MVLETDDSDIPNGSDDENLSDGDGEEYDPRKDAGSSEEADDEEGEKDNSSQNTQRYAY